MAEPEQLHLVGEPLRVTLTYFPDPQPVDGAFCATVAGGPATEGSGDTERAAIEQLAIRLKQAAAQLPPAGGVTGASQALVAAARYDLEALTDFLQAHADVPVLAG